MTAWEIFTKYLLPHWMDGSYLTIGSIITLKMYHLHGEMNRRKTWEEKIERRITALVKIHCAKYPRHSAAFQEWSNGGELREAMSDMKRICDGGEK